MAKLINLFGTFHNSTKRSYSERMNNEKIECIIKLRRSITNNANGATILSIVLTSFAYFPE